MNMNEVYRQLMAFDQSLRQFSDALNTAWKDVEARHGQLDPMWQDDDLQKRYMALWQPLSETLSRYRTRELPVHLDHLNRKKILVEKYLNGPV